MLFFVGLGLEQSPTLKALRILKDCDYVYYESYTSPVVNVESFTELSRELESVNFESVKREFVEDGRKVLDLAKSKKVALVCSGDPMIATTHQELRTRAIKEGVETRIIHGSSILCSVIGELGLHSYNFGRTVTMTKEPMQYTAYNTIFQNLLRGLHTTILLEWDESHGFFLLPKQAVESLFEAEKDLKHGIISNDTLVLVASRLGSEDEKVHTERLGDVLESDFGKPPHILVIPGRLHFTEREALAALTKKDPNSFPDNSVKAEKISKMMVLKYSEKTLAALGRARMAAAKAGPKEVNFHDVFENVECYTQDALRFLNEGKEELAVLSIGYAEGLLDSLRFAGLLEFEW